MSAEAIHATFGEFMRAVGIPMHLAHPDHRRLDGQETVGNWEVTSHFRWRDRTWRVHADCHYEPLLLAYYSWQHLHGEDTFVEASMENAQRLDLAPQLAQMRPTQHRYLYIYEEKAR